jgi:tetratricopeptide (TPR) repeat protein
MCANILNNLGVIEARSGELERAEEFFRQASGRYVEVDSLESLFYAATTLGSLGMIRRELGKMDDARDAYSDALEIAQKLLDKSGDDELYKAVAMRLINELEEMKNAL